MRKGKGKGRKKGRKKIDRSVVTLSWRREEGG
jgi:hypothetical protein